jgi:hypothetical protein
MVVMVALVAVARAETLVVRQVAQQTLAVVVVLEEETHHKIMVLQVVQVLSLFDMQQFKEIN